MIPLRNNQWFPSGIAWGEYVPENGTSSSDWSLSYGDNHAIMGIWVDPFNVLQAVADLLGSNASVPTSSTAAVLTRTPPMQHPVFTSLYAERITSIKGFGQPIKELFPGSSSGVVTAVYPRYLMTVLFTQPEYRVLTDAQLAFYYGQPLQEWQRYLQGLPASRIDTLTLAANTSINYVEQNVANNTPPLSGGIFAVPIQWRQFLKYNDYNLIWRKVPLIGLLDKGGTGRPKNLESALQTVNDATFMDCATNTLKFEGFSFKQLQSPIPPELQLFNPQAGVGFPNLCVDVLLSFNFFDPPTDVTSGASTHGHNNVPYIPNGQWYLAKWTTAGAGGASQLMFPTSTFSNIFNMLV